MRSSTTAAGPATRREASSRAFPGAAKTGTGAGSRREGADELECLLELAIGFARKAHHDIGAERELGAGRLEQRCDLFGVVPGTIAAMHAAQHGVGAGLQRKMRVARQPRSAKFPHETDQVRIPVHGLDGAEPKPRQSVCSKICWTKRGERWRGLFALQDKVAPPAAQVDPGEHQFVAAGGDEVR